MKLKMKIRIDDTFLMIDLDRYVILYFVPEIIFHEIGTCLENDQVTWNLVKRLFRIGMIPRDSVGYAFAYYEENLFNDIYGRM